AHTMLTPRAAPSLPHSIARTLSEAHADGNPADASTIRIPLSEVLAASAEDRVGQHTNDETEKSATRSYLFLMLVLVLAAGGSYSFTELKQVSRDNSPRVTNHLPTGEGFEALVTQSPAVAVLREQVIERPVSAWSTQAAKLRPQMEQGLARLSELAPELVHI